MTELSIRKRIEAADAYADKLLAMSDDEFKAHLTAQGIDPDAHCRESKEIVLRLFDNAKQIVNNRNSEIERKA